MKRLTYTKVFFVIFGQQDEFIEVVLSTAALLFAPEIDEQLWKINLQKPFYNIKLTFP